MSITSTTENRRALEFLLSEASGQRSRSQVTLLALNDAATILPAGQVLGKITKGAATAAADAGNTGNGVMGAITTAAGLKLGVYVLEIVKANTNAGLFNVYDPDGILVGIGNVASAFTGGGLSFTLADGSTDFAVGDLFRITVAAGTGKLVKLDVTGKDGREVAAAILADRTDVSGATDVQAAVIDLDAEVDGALLNYNGADTTHVAAANVQLLALGIKVRTGTN